MRRAENLLGPGGRQLWQAVTAEHDMNPAERAILLEACRAKDRLDQLAATAWPDPLTVADPARLAIATGHTLKKLVAALRLPDPTTGRRPQYRGPRGAYR